MSRGLYNAVTIVFCLMIDFIQLQTTADPFVASAPQGSRLKIYFEPRAPSILSRRREKEVGHPIGYLSGQSSNLI